MTNDEKPIRQRKAPVRWGLGRLAVFLILGLLITGGGVATMFASNDFSADAAAQFEAKKTAVAAEQARVDAVKAAKEAIQKAAAEEAAQKVVDDRIWAADGFLPAGDHVYYRFADTNEYRCGYWDCTAIYVASTKGCASGFYVEAAITNGSIDVGMTNKITAASPANNIVAVLLEDHLGGSGFRLAKINCM